MDVAQITGMMYALRNPAGIPTHPLIFIGLGVLTFALHILFVQMMLGTGLVTLMGAFKTDKNWRRLAMAMLEVAKVSVSVAIVVGVAPLLFVQVVYDPQWYTSNVLSADWVIGFILLLIVGYWALYFYYFKNAKREDKTAQPTSRWSLILSLGLLLVVGFIMHVLTSQMLHPDQWQNWYMANGVMDYSGNRLHEYNLVRFAFFISLAIPVTGALMVSYRRFKMVREDADQAYLAWAANLGKQWILVGSVISAVLYIGWMMTLPETAGDFFMGWGLLGLVGVLLLPFWSLLRLRGPSERMCSYMALPMALVAGLLIAISRELLRYTILNDYFHYNFLDYKVVEDWYSTGLFFGTFAFVGGAVLAYFLTVAWKAGQTVGIYTPGPGVRMMGTVAIWITFIWIVHFFAVGFYVWAQ
jgi:hypothetical protein